MGVQMRAGMALEDLQEMSTKRFGQTSEAFRGNAPHWANVGEGAWETAGPRELSKTSEDSHEQQCSQKGTARTGRKEREHLTHSCVIFVRGQADL